MASEAGGRLEAGRQPAGALTKAAFITNLIYSMRNMDDER
jgi:hypothetical protein